jgi:hypothetical protein
MEEARLYKWWEFLFVVLCGIVSIIGVYIIVKKPKLRRGEVEVRQSQIDPCEKCAKCTLENIKVEN